MLHIFSRSRLTIHKYRLRLHLLFTLLSLLFSFLPAACLSAPISFETTACGGFVVLGIRLYPGFWNRLSIIFTPILLRVATSGKRKLTFHSDSKFLLHLPCFRPREGGASFTTLRTMSARGNDLRIEPFSTRYIGRSMEMTHT
jgi:hypothetical protein